MEVDLQQVQQVNRRQRPVPARARSPAEAPAPRSQGRCGPAPAHLPRRRRPRTAPDPRHRQWRPPSAEAGSKGPSALYCFDHHQGSGRGGSGGDGAQRDGRGQQMTSGRAKCRATRAISTSAVVITARATPRSRRAASHVLQGAEPELVADDEGDKAQRHLWRMP